MNIFKNTIHFFTCIIYFFIGVYVMILVPMLFGFTPLVVLSGSMEPTYKTGSIIYYEKVLQDEIAVGDVIVFSIGDNKVVSHRVVDIVNDKYVTKGDKNQVIDALPIEYQFVVGKIVKFNVPYLGYYVSFINKNLYLLVFVGLILVSEFFLGQRKDVDIDNKKKGVKRYGKRNNKKNTKNNCKEKRTKKSNSKKD